MPIIDATEAQDLDAAIERLVSAASKDDRERRLREVFVEKLDFTPSSGHVDLRGEKSNIESVARIATAEGVHVVWAPLDSQKVLVSESRAVSKAVNTKLGDHLLVLSSTDSRLWHLIYPTQTAGKPVLRRMVIERGLPRRTVVTQLAKVYHEAQKADIRCALESAYDVEPVTKEFFRTYRETFDRVMAMIRGVPNEEQRRLFCQTLFNRLMFLYFVQRKGWLKFSGDSNYLPALLRASKAAGNENFFRDRLKVLFFAGLNNPQSVDVSRGASPAIGEVPFLNGGLFEEGDIDLQCANAAVPNEAFDAIFAELFERFNFTVSENTPYDIEVAVDPEMLGKVFEELVTGRHETGSYYTPRLVVAFMCREALKGYLETKVEGLSPDAVRSFVDEHDVSGLDVTQAGKVAEALDEVTVCDPACGSGAYLVGMLHELIELKQALYSERLGREPTKLFEMKLHIIERNLYGADIDRFAINIAMLRLWLSLIIDFEGETPPPLPNLDFKIVCGDSLTAPNPQHAPDLFRHEVHDAAGQLAELKGRYMRESGPHKPHLKAQIQEAEDRLRRALAESPAPANAVDWRVEFAEVFDSQAGFDIVLANPPYGLDFLGRFTTGPGNVNSYASFVLLALDIGPEALISFIVPTSWETGEKFVPFRRELLNRTTIRKLVNLPYDVFAAAYVDTSVLVIQGGRAGLLDFSMAALPKVGGSIERVEIHWVKVTRDEVLADEKLRIPLSPALATVRHLVGESPWGRLDQALKISRGLATYQYRQEGAPFSGSGPLFDGNVYRFRVVPGRNRMWVAVPQNDPRFFQGTWVAIRRLIGRDNRLMAAVMTEQVVVKEAILVGIPKISVDLNFIAGMLNSSLHSFIHLALSAIATKDDFRQVTIFGLNELPLPSDAICRRRIAELGRLLREHYVKAADSYPDQLEEALDREVFDAFAIPPDVRGQVAGFLSASG